MEKLIVELKKMIVSSLELEDVSWQDIGDHEQLFGDGLGLDSIDALELGIALEKTYGVSIDEDDESLHEYFRTVHSLAQFVEANRQ